jgi:hypothetical protein
VIDDKVEVVQLRGCCRHCGDDYQGEETFHP